MSFTPRTCIPQRWCKYVQCRECKCSIIEVIGPSYLQKGQLFLKGSKSLVLAGCFSGESENNTWMIHPSDTSLVAEPVSKYASNVEEADTCIWQDASQSRETNLFIYSPDTDIYNIHVGLSLAMQTSKQFTIQINMPHSAQK